MIHVFWALLSGQLLPSRGAIFPALKAIGLEDAGVRRGWTAVNSGVWQTTTLISQWSKHVEGLSEWQRHAYEGYKPVVYLLNILGIRIHRPEGFLEKLVEPLKPSGRFPSFLRRYPVVADVTAFWHPTLRNCPSKHYHPAAGRALPAVIFGVVGKVG